MFNMGNLKENNGSIFRSDLDGRNITTIVPPGGTFTPKQLQIEKSTGKLYWCDREGMRVMRANLDGSKVETLVDTSQGDPRPGPDPTKWCVGIAVDVDGGKIYWTQKGGDNAGEGRIFRANIEIPTGQTPTNRQDIELIYDGLPEPIDLDIDPATRTLYWTDRGDPPRRRHRQAALLTRCEIGQAHDRLRSCFAHPVEGIGLAAGPREGEASVHHGFRWHRCPYAANLDGSDRRTLLYGQGNLTEHFVYEITASSLKSEAAEVGRIAGRWRNRATRDSASTDIAHTN